MFVARFARGTAVSALAACLAPPSHTEAAPTRGIACEATSGHWMPVPELGAQEATDQAVVLTIAQTPSDWDQHLEREFRKLALEEAKGTLRVEQAKRLEQLNRWRDRLLYPQAGEEILLQIKRDRLLARMQELLNDYVEFQEGSCKARAAG